MLTAQADREFFNFLFKLNTYILNFIFLCFLLSRWALQRGERVFNLRNWSWRRRGRWRAGRDVVDKYVKKYNKYKYVNVKKANAYNAKEGKYHPIKLELDKTQEVASRKRCC